MEIDSSHIKSHGRRDLKFIWERICIYLLRIRKYGNLYAVLLSIGSVIIRIAYFGIAQNFDTGQY